MDAVSPIYRTLSVFISHHSPELNAAYDAAARVLMAFPAGHQPDMLDSSSVFVGIFAQHAEVEILSEMDHALRQKKTCLIFILDVPASRRDPELNDLLYQPPPFCRVFVYQNPRELSYRLYRALDEQYKELHHADWQIPVLPLRDVVFGGREDAMQRLSALLTEGQPIIITGSSGIGKTALAKELAYRLRDRFPAGVFWLEPFGKTGQTLQSAFRLIAAAHPAGREAISREQIITSAEIRSWLVNVPLRGLVIADDMADAEALYELDAALPGNFSLMITTADASLLDVNWNRFELSVLNPEDSFTVLRRMLELPSRLAQEVVRPLQEVASMLEGHPLCLRLAAGWMQQAGGWQSALVYMQRLQESSSPALVLPPDVEHHPGIEITFHVLYQYLSDGEKRLLRTAGVFAPGFPFPGEGLLEVAQMPGAWRELSALVPAILTPDEASGGYRLHSLLSVYARALLVQVGESDSAGFRHLDYYETQAARYMQPDGDDDCIIGTGQPRHAFFHARDVLPYRLVQYVLTAGQYLQLSGEDDELRLWLDAVINADAKSIVPPEYGDDRWTLPTNLRGLGDLAGRIGHNRTA
ncbi:MAG TPA: NB-ARC domain-containing protein, partial [Aggregatilineales bacterium]|nr:NB-ARC domain-containing protein [Aggregatilineales bacterium]